MIDLYLFIIKRVTGMLFMRFPYLRSNYVMKPKFETNLKSTQY